MKKGQIVAYIEQLGTFVPVEVSTADCPPCSARHQQLEIAGMLGNFVLGDVQL